MKRLFFTALIGLSLATSSYATDESKVSRTIKNNFKEDFKGVENVKWTMRSEFVKATFNDNGQMVDVFYDFRGNKLGTSHGISQGDLPISARRLIEKKYAGSKIIEAIEFTGIDEQSFYVTLENNKEILVLKINDASSVSLFKKTKKENFW